MTVGVSHKQKVLCLDLHEARQPYDVADGHLIAWQEIDTNDGEKCTLIFADVKPSRSFSRKRAHLLTYSLQTVAGDHEIVLSVH